MELYRTLTGQSQQSKQSDQSPTQQQVQQRSRPPLQHTQTQSSTLSTLKDPLAGHLNHLTPQQEAALARFRKTLQDQGLWTPGANGGKASHDDATLLRYLRARKFDVRGAVGQFSDTEHWLKEQHVEELYEHYDVDRYERARRMYPQWTGHRDRRGIPLYVYVIKHLDSKHVSAYQKDAEKYKKTLPLHKSLQTPAKLLPLFALYHNLLNFVLPMCSTLERPNPEVPVTNSTNIVDISGVGLTQFWNLKAHMQDASVLATAHYPETLDRIFIIGAPSFFPTVWGWIKRWFDPVTVSKIFILGKHEVKSTLSAFIDQKDFPKRYGGSLDWEFGELPHMDEASLAAVESDGRQGWIEGPCLWLEHRRFAVGTVNGKPRRPDSEIAGMKPVVYAADQTEEPVHPDAALKEIDKDAEKQEGLKTGGVVPPGASQIGEAGPPAYEAPVAAAEATTTPSEKKHQVGFPTANGSIDTMNPAHPTTSYQTEHPTSTTAPTQADGPTLLTQTASTERPGPERQSDQIDNATPIQSTDSNDHANHPTQPVPEQATGTLGQVNAHETLVNDITTKKMQDESVSVIPNGSLSAGQPEMTVASDPAKGLAMETERQSMNGAAKPPMERFVTAYEDPAIQVNGKA